MNARDALRALILADTGLAELGGRVYPRWVKQATARPYVTLVLISEVPEHGLGGPCGLINSRVQVDVWADNQPDVERLATLIRHLLDGHTGDVTIGEGEDAVTLDMDMITMDTSDSDIERFNDYGDAVLERVSMDYLTAHREQA